MTHMTLEGWGHHSDSGGGGGKRNKQVLGIWVLSIVREMLTESKNYKTGRDIFNHSQIFDLLFWTSPAFET